ncbi:DinB family protein [Sedimentitalea arenosa]|uniref:DinB family protein n=1 Tax=Sedimentitalea arenosa TaxID=2798803 RepID=A0A8J7J347_9RHOB|nr:DinB family protein [Arenibacterium arenosum]MBJ6370745.1 DinB family protein [Arenibacterium arenosum]
MIDRAYCVLMARYNAWQNRQLFELLKPLHLAELTRDRGAFFGSILGTLNHLLWGDLLWMVRLDGGERPAGGIGDSTTLHPTLGAWDAARFRADGRIMAWADRLNAVDLTGDLSWYSGALGRHVTKPIAQCIVHMFNHQTHHRGQVHAMMTAAGLKGAVSDLVFMSEDA